MISVNKYSNENVCIQANVFTFISLYARQNDKKNHLKSKKVNILKICSCKTYQLSVSTLNAA